MKKIMLIAVMALFVSVVVASLAIAAVSSPCSGYTKPKAAPAPRQAVVQDYRRDVLGQKVPVYTHAEGNAATDTATKYEEKLMTGES